MNIFIISMYFSGFTQTSLGNSENKIITVDNF
jgi:hypothetical protein